MSGNRVLCALNRNNLRVMFTASDQVKKEAISKSIVVASDAVKTGDELLPQNLTDTICDLVGYLKLVKGYTSRWSFVSKRTLVQKTYQLQFNLILQTISSIINSKIKRVCQ